MMDAETPALASRPRVRLYVFSITVDWERLATVLREPGGSLCFLTPHHLLPDEHDRLRRLGAGEYHARTFHDLLETKDMEWCDEEADRRVLARHHRRDARDDLVAEYYAVLTRLKNACAATRLQAEFAVDGGAVLCGDLGIVPGEWVARGLVDLCPPPARPLRWSRLRRLFTDPLPFHWLDWQGGQWLLAGRPSRVEQYLVRNEIALRPLGRATVWWLNLLLIAMPRRHSTDWLRSIFRGMLLTGRRTGRPVTQLAAAVHEHSAALAGLAGLLGLDYVNLQDSFLPAYYPSRYLRYRPQVRRFYVWDRFSQGIFERHGIESTVWAGYRSWTLPAVAPAAESPVCRILYLASGAGDWTALKNRSDEDLVFVMLMEVARLRPDLAIRYRPHPLWLHPEHQGVDSIRRIMACLEDIRLPNLMVSHGAREDGQGFARTGNLSAVSSSVNEDIGWADLVLGEHSQTMLVAARQGKVVAGINVARHPPFFGDYARIGFPLVSSAADLLALLGRMDDPKGGRIFREEYNASVVRHNLENCEASQPA